MLQIKQNENNEKMKMKKILRCINQESIHLEVGRIGGLMRDPMAAMESNYNIHKVPVNGIPYMVADAIAVNKAMNQSGRGCMRHTFDLKSRGYVGLAQEIDSGSYRMVR